MLKRLLLAFFWIIAINVLAIGLWMVLTDGAQSIASLKCLQFVQTLCIFACPTLVVAFIWSKHPMQYLHLCKAPSCKEAILVSLLVWFASPFVNLLSYLNQQIKLPSFLHTIEVIMQEQEQAAAVLTEQFIQADNIGVLVLNICLMALLPAVCEELFFRGFLMRLFLSCKWVRGEQLRTQLAIWGTAFIFSAVHFQFYGFFPRLLLGAFFGYLLVWSHSLWLPILGHFINNAWAVVWYNAYYMRGLSVEDVDTYGTGDTLWMGIVSGALCISLLFYLRYQYKRAYRKTK